MSNDLLEDLLNTPSEGIASFEKEDIKLAPLLDEINLIHDLTIKSFVRSILYQAESFWKIPSSFSGKYHPPDERTAGGNVLHTKRVVRIVQILCRSQERGQPEIDILTAAAIIHDVTKGITREDNTCRYDPMHPYTIDQFVGLVLSNDELNISTANRSSGLYLSDEILAQILRLVHCHMGSYSPIPETIPITGLEWILHFADVIATQLHHVIDGGDIQDWRWNAPRKRRPKTPQEDLPN